MGKILVAGAVVLVALYAYTKFQNKSLKQINTELREKTQDTVDKVKQDLNDIRKNHSNNNNSNHDHKK